MQSVVPAGGISLNNGTWGCAKFGGDIASALKRFYPKDACADWLLRQAFPDARKLDLGDYARKLSDPAAKLPQPWERFDLLTAVDVFSLGDWDGLKKPDGTLREAWERAPLDLPLTFNDPGHGLLQARTGNDKDALYLMFEARPDLRGVGHQHHDSGHFYLASDGEMWATEAGPKNSFSADHNTVQIDGRGHSDISAAPRVGYLGTLVNDAAAFASANLRNAYDCGWTTPMHFSWLMEENRKGLWKLQPDMDSELVAYYKGTQNVKMRIWGESYWQNNWGPVMRIPGNPVLYAWRSAGIVRGKHSYALIVDDINKDDKEHYYEWLMQMPNGMRLANMPLRVKSAPAILLTRAAATQPWDSGRSVETLPKGTPAMLVCLLEAGRDDDEDKPVLANVVENDNFPFRLEQFGSPQRPGSAAVKTRLAIGQRAVDPAFRVLMVPVRTGGEMPEIQWDAGSNSATIQWHDQKDECVFTKGPEKRTRVVLKRDGAPIGETK